MNKPKKQILAVEDYPSTLRALVDKFTREGFDVLEARDGEEGLELALKEHPDLILLDLKMPKMDGITMLKNLQADDSSKDIPVIILTNLNELEKMAEALESEAYDYLVKTDWKLKDIVKKVKEKLGIK